MRIMKSSAKFSLDLFKEYIDVDSLCWPPIKAIVGSKCLHSLRINYSTLLTPKFNIDKIY